MRFTLHCTCGGAAVGSIRPDDKAEKIKAVWLSVHSGEGHAECDADTARRARLKSEKEAFRDARK